MAKQARAAAGEGLIEEVLAMLRERGGRATSARRLLLEALAGSSGHRTAEQLAADVQAQAPDVNLSTIYRNLDELERLQVVDRTHTGHGPATYHLASATTHGHLVCQHCGSVTEVPDSLFSEAVQAARKRYGFAIEPHRLALMGTCANCG